MATYYVSGIVGDDTYNGLGPDASHATNKPFRTLDKALSTLAAGDTVYIGPGLNRPLTNSSNVIDTSGTSDSRVCLYGDPLNKRGFKNSSGVSLDPYPAIVTVYSTDSGSSAYYALQGNPKNYYTIEDIWFDGGAGGVYLTLTSNNFIFNRCCFTVNDGNANAVNLYFSSNHVASMSFNQCTFMSAGTAFSCTPSQAYTVDTDVGVTLDNCFFITTYISVNVANYNGASANMGGVIFTNCTIIGSYGVYGRYNTANVTIPHIVRNCVIYAYYGIYGNTQPDTTWISSSYNLLFGSVLRTMASASVGEISLSGANDGATRFNLGMNYIWGLPSVPFFTPLSSSQHAISGSNDYGNFVDFLGRPNPSGTQTTTKPMGHLAIHDYGVKDTSVKDAGDASLKLVGPGDHEFYIPVDSASLTNVSIKTRFDSTTYSGSNYPKATILDIENFTSITNYSQSVSASIAASDAWETLTFTPFSGSRKGAIRLRVENMSISGSGICWFDTVTVT